MIPPAVAPGGEVLVYESPDGEVRVDMRLDHETVWLNQEQMGQLFGRERSVITKHVRNVFREGELEPEATCAKFAQVQTEGERTVTRDIDHYNLDVIISVGSLGEQNHVVDDVLVPLPGGHVAGRLGDHVLRVRGDHDRVK